MKIKNNSMKLCMLFELEEGDIFLYENCYYIAGETCMIDHRRNCYNLTLNTTKEFIINHTVYAWDGRQCELIVR